MLRTPLLTLPAMLRVTVADQFSVSRTKSKSLREKVATKINNKLISGLISIKLILPFQTSRPFLSCNMWEERTSQMGFWDVQQAVIRARRSLSVTSHVTVPWAMGMLEVNHIMVISMSSLKRKPRNSLVSTLIAQVENTAFKRTSQLKTSLPSRDISKTCQRASSLSRNQKTCKWIHQLSFKKTKLLKNSTATSRLVMLPRITHPRAMWRKRHCSRWLRREELRTKRFSIPGHIRVRGHRRSRAISK